MSSLADSRRLSPFSHEAFFYASDDEYLAGTASFVEAGLRAGEPVLVAVPTVKLELLRKRFGGSDGDLLFFASMDEMGRNPAWIIPAWADFVGAHLAPGRTARGIGEPIWSGRSADELVECERHEALLNLAFADADGFRLLCPYDLASLDPKVVDEAHRNHPSITRPDGTRSSDDYHGKVPACLATPLPPVPATAEILRFDARALGPVRQRAAAAAAAAGLPRSRTRDLALAVTEAATNSVVHGGGTGQIVLWQDGSRFLCEVRDRGQISDPLAGRIRPRVDQLGGRGLWIMNQVCDLVQIRESADGQVIRLHIAA